MKHVIFGCLGLLILFPAGVRAANQTPDLSAIDLTGNVPYRIQLRQFDFGPEEMPTLQSYAAGVHDGKWVLISGRTNGLHGFTNNSSTNFPAAAQNREVWVIDPVSRQSWSRPLDDPTSGLSEATILSLTPTNTQFYQRADRLYMTGGYGVAPAGGFNTFDTLTAIDLPDMIDWVVSGAGSASAAMRQIADPAFKVTGGAMYEIDGRTHLVFGQDFVGGYNPSKNGTYTNQVRSFNIVDDGVLLSVNTPSSTTPDPAYRRRDLNVFPAIRSGPGGLENELVVLSGVFTETNGAWTVPVEVDATGQTTMADPNLPSTFKQGMNNYHSAKLGLYSEGSGAMHEVLFGGISLQYIDPVTGLIATDDNFPFINEITSVAIDAAGNYTQHLLGEFPELLDNEGKRLRFGANAEFFHAEGVPIYDNGVIKFDELTGQTVLGYIFGGIAANAPHVRGVPGAASAASDLIFEVVLVPVPEPGAWVLIISAGIAMLYAARRRG
ncbi:MAG: hypothetical protein WD851_20035 [Pirellulales bacterium]